MERSQEDGRPIDPTSKRQRCIIALDDGPLSTVEVAARLGLEPMQVSQPLRDLAVAGLVARAGKKGKHTVWSTDS